MEGKPLPPSPPLGAAVDPALREPIEQAKVDLSGRLGVAVGQIEVVEARSVVWPDRGLGCPQPGMLYTQVPQDGLLIVLRVAGQVYRYHGGATRPPFLCTQPATGTGQGDAPPARGDLSR
jgi:hypothetical protein